MSEAVAFYVIAALILIFGILVVSARNTVYSVLFLVANFLCVAVLYLLLHAEFLAVIQILVYAGGIVVLYLFVVMLVSLKHPEVQTDQHRHDKTGFLLAGATLAQLVAVGIYSFAGTPMAATAGGGAANVTAIGRLLYVDYLVPFEVASILLLLAMVGAIILARREW